MEKLFVYDLFSQKRLYIEIENNHIAKFTPTNHTFDSVIIPKFCDLQVNGAKGLGFTSNSLTLEHIQTIANVLYQHNTNQFLPTVITSDFETIQHAFSTLARAVSQDKLLGQMIPGFHLEGPYLSPIDGPRGAHPKQHIRPANISEFSRWQEAARGMIRIVTLAPEQENAIEFIKHLVRKNIIVSLGHTQADSEQIRQAVDAGATLSTHLGNGCHAHLPRHPNQIWDQLADDQLSTTVIADGHHLPESFLKTVFRAKSMEKTILISDAGEWAGSPAGRYQSWGSEIEKHENGKIVLAGTPYLAGSGVFLDHCANWLVSTGFASWKDVVQMACINPRKLLGLECPEIKIGSRWTDFQKV